ncbi:MAG: hypothetical protein ACO394_09530 [Blastocatellia bacterium]
MTQKASQPVSRKTAEKIVARRGKNIRRLRARTESRLGATRAEARPV